MEVINMKLVNDYPLIYKKVNRFLRLRKIIRFIYLIGLITSFIVNLAVGGKLWCIYVLGGEIITYYAFFNKPLINNVLLKRITFLILFIILYLYAIDLVNKTNWSYYVINIISFSLLLFQFLFFFINYDQHKNKIILMFLTSIFSILFFLLAILTIFPINWAVIVTGSIGLLIITILLSFYFKTTILELKKYFSLK